MYYGLLNVASFALGLVACIFILVGFVRSQSKQKNTLVFSVGSVGACALSLCLQIVYTNHLVRIADWSALMDISPTVTVVSSALLVVTLALNAVLVVRFFRAN